MREVWRDPAAAAARDLPEAAHSLNNLCAINPKGRAVGDSRIG
jgi:hypothetical protein